MSTDNNNNNKKLFCFGYGYTCEYLGHELMNRGGWRVAGTTRDNEKRQTLRARGVDAHIFDNGIPLGDPLYLMQGTTHLLLSIPPGGEGDPAFLAHGEAIARMKSLEWVGYLSTTGVYGDRGGAWVDEKANVNPTSQRGSRRVKAEEQWLSLLKNHNVPVHIFRLSGIYGPGNCALDSVRAGVARRIHKPGQVFGRIHVEDIVQVLMASFARPNPGGIYNVTDDEAVPSHEVISYACELMKKPEPPLVPIDEANLAPMTRSFYSECRRVRNNRIKAELGVDLKYKNYREGLQGCMKAEDYALSVYEKAQSSPLAFLKTGATTNKKSEQVE